jgi:hypothetical protein
MRCLVFQRSRPAESWQKRRELLFRSISHVGLLARGVADRRTQHPDRRQYETRYDKRVSHAAPSLVELKDLIHLEALNLKGTEVTDAGVRDIQQALPKAIVERLPAPSHRCLANIGLHFGVEAVSFPAGVISVGLRGSHVRERARRPLRR